MVESKEQWNGKTNGCVEFVNRNVVALSLRSFGAFAQPSKSAHFDRIGKFFMLCSFLNVNMDLSAVSHRLRIIFQIPHPRIGYFAKHGRNICPCLVDHRHVCSKVSLWNREYEQSGQNKWTDRRQ